MLSFKPYKLSYVIILLIVIGLAKKVNAQQLRGWDTNTDKSTIELSELKRGGPPKDGIPSIDDPKFVSLNEASSWIAAKEPVLSVEHEGEARAYPLQIMIWHEIVNDEIQGDPLLVTFCPLCYSALVFERTVNGETLEFGVSGFLRHSDLVMFDRKTETLWQQFTGKAIVGDYVGTTLEQISSQIISFEQFRKSYPDGLVLSKNTGYDRNYGRNPYTGYDDINNSPLFGAGNDDDRLPPMEKVIGVKLDEHQKAYPYSVTKKKQVINDKLGETPLVVIHTGGATSAMDAARIAESKESGSTGVFKRVLDGTELTFVVENGNIVDKQTGSVWSVTGKAVKGEHEGQQLETVTFGDYFAFAWLVFWPETEIYTNN
ncbi:DUF3179 domain-containing protein [Fodinibius sp.]|uniref:DUF3179 domain-containing protein n=1 Tax=Fodinibius sp. TaxID=1872440 RepID=UPI002ACDFDF7|nr:DUF3179 domain-containing protein [Fodinibius sp.]MDZ7659000.1 DUF3179 domain-containing protein [Fodinibius sp.]